MGLEHANCVAIDGVGVLIRGASGAGKSDLSLRLIDEGAALVSDDYTLLAASDGQVLASPPPEIAGRIEARGLGLLRLPHAAKVSVRLIVDLVPLAEEERMPERRTAELEGCTLPSVALWGFAASAPAKVRLALAETGGVGNSENSIDSEVIQ